MAKNELELSDLLQKERAAIEKVGEDLLAGKKEEVAAGLGGLFVSVLSGVPALGGLAKGALAVLFASPANVVLEKQVEQWREEQDHQRFVQDLSDVIEALIGQALVQIVRSQKRESEDVVAALGGLREDLATFREEVGERMTTFDLHVQLQEVSEGAIGIRVSGSSRKRVFVDRLVVRGGRTVGIEM
jgi:hypothetical protein